MKASELIKDQRIVIIRKGIAGIFEADEIDPERLEEVPVRLVKKNVAKGEGEILSPFTIKLRPNDRVYPIRENEIEHLM